jgi:hypothetical protein
LPTQARNPGLEVAFLVDSLAQLDSDRSWHEAPQCAPFDVLLEIGVAGGAPAAARTRTRWRWRGVCAQRQHAWSVIECYEGLGATGQTGPTRTTPQP